MPYSKEEAKNGTGKLGEDFKKNQVRLRTEAEVQIGNNIIRPHVLTKKEITIVER